MSSPFDPRDAVFQIGEDNYGYKYRSSTMRCNGSPVYQCIRCIDPNCMVKCLWLYKSADGHWIATEAPKTAFDPINGGTPTFRTTVPVEDITWHHTLDWQYFKTSAFEWEGAMTFAVYPYFVSSSSGRSDSLWDWSGSTSHAPSEPASEPTTTTGFWQRHPQ